MGKLEAQAKHERRLGEFERAILGVTAAAGIVAVGVIAPKLLSLVRYIPQSNSKFRYRTKSTLTKLATRGLITFSSEDGKRYARLTEKGEKHMEYETQKLVLTQNARKRWDKRWRIVTFDIPEARRRTRTQLRYTMQEAGFYRLQNSVWVLPYDCEDLITLLKADLKVGKDVLYIIAEHIEHDAELRSHFNLPAA